MLTALATSMQSKAECSSIDTLSNHQLKTVEVSRQFNTELRSATPQQSRSQKDFYSLNAINVANVVNSFSGVNLKDYGGIGGMKTVSVRGMDALYTGVSYDGIMMSNIQSGQIDVGRFPLENIAEISLTNGQLSDIFQSARSFASGNVLCLKTQLPENTENLDLHGKAYLKGGSFGMLNPGFLFYKNLNKKWAFNLSSDGMTANGRYNFIQHYGPSSNNVSKVLKRTNADVHTLRSEINALYRVTEKEYLTLKTNLFLSDRGLPGSVVYYTIDNSQQRLKDRTLFAQAEYKNKNSQRFYYQILGRYNNTYTEYSEHNSKYSQTEGLLRNEYAQDEYYLSFSGQYKIAEELLLSMATDWWYNQLNISSNVDFHDFQYPTRHTGMANLALKYNTGRFSIVNNVLYTLTREAVKTGNASPNRNQLSPSLSASYRLMEDKEYRLRFFYKNIYRLPTFNDLYYEDIGNPYLEPENANLFNIGFTGIEKKIAGLNELSFTADAYYNHIANKIIAIPKDGFHWSMTNRGLVKIVGADISLKAKKSISTNNLLKIRMNYSLQRATDATPENETYGEQIPYIPMNLGTASISFSHRWLEFGYNFMYSGIRWVGQTTDWRNMMPAYNTHSLFTSVRYRGWQLNAEVINLLNTQYEVIRFYPMPGRNFRLGLFLKF